MGSNKVGWGRICSEPAPKRYDSKMNSESFERAELQKNPV